jgi:hypothetical protein
MAKAILELEMPESCLQCDLYEYINGFRYCRPKRVQAKSLDEFNQARCSQYVLNRHPDCPLKLVEGKGVE